MIEPTWTTACPDWEKRIVANESLIPCGALFPGEAAEAMAVYKELRIVDLPGSPKAGEVSKDWVLEFPEAIFGAYNPETAHRLIREFFLLISKKNGKSTTAAEIMLTALIRNWRKSAEFLILAPTKEVADNSFIPARDAIRADPELNDLMQVQEHLRTITHRISKATLKIVAADSDTVSGKKATGILIDELWAFGKKAKAENMLREATGGLASRPEGFVIYLTTQSEEPPAGVFKAKLDYARAVRDGEIVDPQFLPVLYEFPKAMVKNKAYLEPKHFYISNPNIGASVSPEFLTRELTKAQAGDKESLGGFLAKHLNIEIGANLRADRWPGIDFWEQTTDESITYRYILEHCEVLAAGIDGGGLDDLLGLCIMGRLPDTHEWLAWVHAWAHPLVLERRKSEASRFRDFEAQGDLTIIDSMGEDISQLVDIIEEVDHSDLLYQIGVDTYGIGAILDELEEREIDKDKIIGISQGWKLVGAIKTAERRLAEGTLKHGHQSMMTWCVSNAKVEPRGNSILITKSASGTAKIDPVMAMLNCTQIMATNPKAMSKKYQMFIY